MYNLEVSLVDDFKIAISIPSKPFIITDYATEFNYFSGKTDLIAQTKSGEIIAFEAKLYKWRKAVNQAYRNTTFAHYSYVILPETKINRALSNRQLFEKNRIGLCSIGRDGINIHINAPNNEPVQHWLTTLAKKYINEK